MSDYRQAALELLKGAYEMHVHTAPSHFKRLMDDVEYGKELDRYGMAGAVSKIHFGETAQRVAVFNKSGVSKAKLYGSITLDWGVGGLNPSAVKAALLLGAKIVWMPTLHSLNSIRYFEGKGKEYPVEGPGIRLLDEAGNLRPEVHEIIALVKQFDAVLATGHIGQDEAVPLCKASTAAGVKTVVTHPDSGRENMSAELQAELSKMGCYVEKCWGNVDKKFVSVDDWIKRMYAVGVDHCILVTDFGQKNRVSPCEGMVTAIEALLEHGVPAADIVKMNQTNPKYLLGLE